MRSLNTLFTLKFVKLSLVIVLMAVSLQGKAQIFAVQSSTQLVPPYSVYLSDYATPGNEKLRVILVQRDLTQPSYQLRLVMQVEWNGKVIMRTARTFNPSPIGLDPGVPTIISGAELAPYLDSRNIDFVGYSREQYERTRALPEGSYRISFTAYDYRRQDVQVSNEGSSFYYLSKNEPPMINLPVCGAKVPVRTPQQLIFSWLPRNTASPASAAETQYEFSLYEIRPEGRNPNDVVLSSQPIFKATIDYTQLVYGPAEPLLIENMNYAWRVRAIDTQGRDAFRNNGYSEVCTFTYGGVDPAFIVGGISGLQAEGETERRARIWWEKGDFDSYRIYYKKSGEGHEWFTSDLLGEGLGQASIKGTIVNVDGMEMILLEVSHLGDGWYKGLGRVGVDYLGGAAFTVAFDRIFISEDRNVVLGRIDFVAKGVAAMAGEQLAGQQKREEEKVQEANREEWAEVDFFGKIFLFDNIIIEDITVNGPNITITDSEGNMMPNTEVAAILISNPEKAIIIEDKNGGQWVVEKDGDGTKVSKVEGGGLLSANLANISSEEIDLVKQALRELRKDYSDSKLEKIEKELNAKKQVVDKYIAANNAQYPNPLPGTAAGNEESYSELILIETPAEDSEFKNKVGTYKDYEYQLNKAIVIRAFSRDTNSKTEYAIVASGISISQKNLKEYMAESSENNKPEEEQVEDIKNAIIGFIEDILKQQVYGG